MNQNPLSALDTLLSAPAKPEKKPRPLNDLEKAFVSAYLVVDVPSDRITETGKEAKRIRQLVINKGHQIPLAQVKRKLVTMRKAGKLPKLRDGHGPPSGKKQGT